MPTKSIAVWCESRPGEAKTQYEVHANYWRISGDASIRHTIGTARSDLLEIGVRIVDVKVIDRIRLWVPFKIGREKVRDCSSYFGNPSIAQGIFNDVLSVRNAGSNGSRCIELEGPSSAVFCRVHRFAAHDDEIDVSELEAEDESGGTMLTITSAALGVAGRYATSAADAYFRLRFPTAGGDGLLTILPPHDHAFQSGYEVAEYIDFRLNEARTLPDIVDRKMGVSNGAELKLAAFLAAVPILSNIAISSSQSHKMRVLEQEVWDSYVPGTLPLHMMVYHWKRERGVVNDPSGTGGVIIGPPIQDFSAFIKLSIRRSSWRTLLIYLAIAFIFGILGNLSASLLEYRIGNGWTAVGQSASRNQDDAASGRVHDPVIQR